MSIMAFTDYPILALGDVSGQEAPVRPCEILAYDQDKYCDVFVAGVLTNFKAGYLYKIAGRYGEAPRVPIAELETLPLTHEVTK